MKGSRQITGLRRHLVDLARAELARRKEEAIDPAIVAAARAELESIYDEMSERMAAVDAWMAQHNLPLLTSLPEPPGSA